MIPYITLLLILFVFSILGLFKMDYNLKIGLFYISFIILFLFSGLRYDVGMDYSSYEELYYNSLVGLNPEIKEPGWAIFFYLFRNLNIPFSNIVLLISFISVFCVFIFIYRYSPFPFLSVLIFFCFTQYYTYSFNVMRQCMAAYIFLACLKYVEENKIVAYLFILLFLVLFVHTSSIILIPLFFVLNKKISWWVKLLLLFVSLAMSKFVIHIFMLSETYKIYLSFDQYSSEVSLTTYILILIGCFLFCLEVCFRKWTSSEILMLNLSFCYFVFLSITFVFENTPLIIVFMRVAYYFTPVLIVLIPMLIKKFFSIRSSYILVPIVAIVYSCLFLFTLSSAGKSNKLLPYRTIFSNTATINSM